MVGLVWLIGLEQGLLVAYGGVFFRGLGLLNIRTMFRFRVVFIRWIG